MNEVAIVTGSSRGIGEAIAIEFAKAGLNNDNEYYDYSSGGKSTNGYIADVS